jgi:hypothetical protein
MFIHSAVGIESGIVMPPHRQIFSNKSSKFLTAILTLPMEKYMCEHAIKR